MVRCTRPLGVQHKQHQQQKAAGPMLRAQQSASLWMLHSASPVTRHTHSPHRQVCVGCVATGFYAPVAAGCSSLHLLLLTAQCLLAQLQGALCTGRRRSMTVAHNLQITTHTEEHTWLLLLVFPSMLRECKGNKLQAARSITEEAAGPPPFQHSTVWEFSPCRLTASSPAPAFVSCSSWSAARCSSSDAASV